MHYLESMIETPRIDAVAAGETPEPHVRGTGGVSRSNPTERPQE